MLIKLIQIRIQKRVDVDQAVRRYVVDVDDMARRALVGRDGNGENFTLMLMLIDDCDVDGVGDGR